MTVIIMCFVADPFDPPGHDRFGGGHLFLFDLGRYLVRSGDRVVYVTRRNSAAKPVREEIGPQCTIYRVPVGPPEEIAPARVGVLLEDLYMACVSELQDEFSGSPVLHSHYWIAGEVARRISRERDLLHVHSLLSLGRSKREVGESPEISDELRDKCEVQIFTEADHLIAVCPSELDDLQRLYPEVPQRQATIIPYGVDPNVFYRRPGSSEDFVRWASWRFTEGGSHPL